MEPPVVHSTKRSGKMSGILLLLFIVLAGALAFYVWWNYYYTYSDGNQVGLLQKFSRRGNLFKTYEGELILNSIKGNNNVTIASEKFYFSVTDNNIAQQLANLQGRNVTLHYTQKKKAAFWRGDSQYVVDSIKADHE